eukprot:1505691-Amphidinium_carterae.1
MRRAAMRGCVMCVRAHTCGATPPKLLDIVGQAVGHCWSSCWTLFGQALICTLETLRQRCCHGWVGTCVSALHWDSYGGRSCLDLSYSCNQYRIFKFATVVALAAVGVYHFSSSFPKPSLARAASVTFLL